MIIFFCLLLALITTAILILGVIMSYAEIKSYIDSGKKFDDLVRVLVISIGTVLASIMFIGSVLYLYKNS